jgi:hypothetical protein
VPIILEKCSASLSRDAKKSDAVVDKITVSDANHGLSVSGKPIKTGRQSSPDRKNVPRGTFLLSVNECEKHE